MLTAMLPVSGLRTILLAVEVDALVRAFRRGDGPPLLGDQPRPSGLLERRRLCPRPIGAIGDRPRAARCQIRLIIQTGEALESLARKPPSSVASCG